MSMVIAFLFLRWIMLTFVAVTVRQHRFDLLSIRIRENASADIVQDKYHFILGIEVAEK